MNTIAEAASNSVSADEQWPDRPRLFSVRALIWAVGLLAFCFLMAVLILRSRQLVSIRATELWGEPGTELIRAGRPVELRRPPTATASDELDRYNPGWLDLTELRDIGYFRRIFLDDNSFNWAEEQSFTNRPSSEDPWMQIRFGADPDNPSVSPLTIQFHRNEGWVFPQTGSKMIRLEEQAFRRMKYRLELIAKIDENET